MATFEAFLEAIKQSNLAEVNRLLEEGGFNLLKKGKFRRAEKIGHALCFAAPHPEIMNRLLEIPEFLNNAIDAFHSAASFGNLKMLNRLLEIPEVLNDATSNVLALVIAADQNNFEVVCRLVTIPAVRERARLLVSKSWRPIIQDALNLTQDRSNMFELLKLHALGQGNNPGWLPPDCLLLIAKELPGYFPSGINHRDYLNNEINRAYKEVTKDADVEMEILDEHESPRGKK